MMVEDLIIMVVLSIIVSYVILSSVMLTFRNGIYSDINKLYMALLMGSTMGMIESGIMYSHGNISIWIFILFFIISIILIILIRKLVLVTDKQFIKSMIEHHDMAILMSESILENGTNKDIKLLAKNIIKTLQQEIDWMKTLLK